MYDSLVISINNRVWHVCCRKCLSTYVVAGTRVASYTTQKSCTYCKK